ncbi:MAG: hypothetical protein ABEK50_05550 [bacterium]
MFQTIKTAFMAVCLVVAFLLGVVIYGSVHTNPPALPETNLSGLQLDTYVYSLKQLRDASPETPASVALSPQETSFLVETIPTDFRWGRFRIIDAYLESSGDLIRVLAVAQGPIGLYYRLDYRGTMEFSTDGVTVRISELKIGKFPLSWLITSPRVYETQQVLGESVRLTEGTLDGKGFRGELVRFSVDVSDVLSNR